MSKPQCVAKTNRGRRCSYTTHLALQEDGTRLCVFHDPERKGKAQAMRRRGGKTSARRKKQGKRIPNAPKTMQEAKEMASWIAHAILANDIDAKQGAEAIKAVNAFMKALQYLDEPQLAELKKLAKKLQKERGE